MASASGLESQRKIVRHKLVELTKAELPIFRQNVYPYSSKDILQQSPVCTYESVSTQVIRTSYEYEVHQIGLTIAWKRLEAAEVEDGLDQTSHLMRQMLDRYANVDGYWRNLTYSSFEADYDKIDEVQYRFETAILTLETVCD